MPEIILSETLNEQKGLTRGQKREWPSSTIKQISSSLGRDDWYELSDVLDVRVAGRSLKRKSTKKEEA